MAVNKVVYGNDTLMDITDTTATAEDVASGKVFYGANGTRTTGSASYTETDPIYSASAAATISSSDITNWNNKVGTTDYANENTGGVIKSMTYFSTAVGSTGTLYCEENSYSTYQSKDNRAFISKGTLENVITGKGLLTNTDYADDSTGGVFKTSSDYGTSLAANGVLKCRAVSFDEYNDTFSTNGFISQGTLENVISGKGLVDTTDLATKQDTLVSGTNIKTINNQSLLGSGNISISGGSGSSTDVQINGTSIVSNDVANIVTETAYDSSDNKIATMSDVDNKVEYINASFLKTAAQGSTTITSEQRNLIGSNNLFYYTEGDYVYRSVGTRSNGMEINIMFESELHKKYNFYINRNNYVTMTEYGIGVDDIKINNTSIVSSRSANIVTNTAYNSSSNKIATMSDITNAGYLPTSGGTLTGTLTAQNNTNYTTKQVRNVVFSTSEPTSSDGANGDIWIKYS